MTPFQATATALASTVGTGNIAGVATALSVGGPGAIYWISHDDEVTTEVRRRLL